MANHKNLVPILLKWEGGFVNDPLDRGGATNKGVTIATYAAYRKAKGLATATIDDLKRMSDAEWAEIMKQLYWDKWRADEIKSQSVANILVDWVWGSGKWGIIIPQRILGVAQDGVVGSATIAALNSCDPRKLFEAIKVERIKFVDGIIANNPSQKRFENGWKNRINSFKYEE